MWRGAFGWLNSMMVRINQGKEARFPVSSNIWWIDDTMTRSAFDHFLPLPPSSEWASRNDSHRCGHDKWNLVLHFLKNYAIPANWLFRERNTKSSAAHAHWFQTIFHSKITQMEQSNRSNFLPATKRSDLATTLPSCHWQILTIAMTSYMVRRNMKCSSRNIKGIKQDGSTNGGSDPRICGVVAPDLRGVNLVPAAQCSGPPPPSSPAPAFGTVQHNTVNTNFQPPATPTPTQRTEGLPPIACVGWKQ